MVLRLRRRRRIVVTVRGGRRRRRPLVEAEFLAMGKMDALGGLSPRHGPRSLRIRGQADVAQVAAGGSGRAGDAAIKKTLPIGCMYSERWTVRWLRRLGLLPARRCWGGGGHVGGMWPPWIDRSGWCCLRRAVCGLNVSRVLIAVGGARESSKGRS